MRSNGRIRAGIIVAGPGSGASLDLFESIMETVNVRERAILINLSSGQCPNLKTVLKYMNQHATSQALNVDEEVGTDGAKVRAEVEFTKKIPLI